MPALDKLRESVAELHPSTVVELRVRDVVEALREVEMIEKDRDRWATRMRALEKRLQSVVAVASGVQL